MTDLLPRQDINERDEAAESTASRLTNEPMDSTDPAEPMQPMDSTEPIEPMDSTEPVELIDSSESCER
jgi:hypothetical protein